MDSRSIRDGGWTCETCGKFCHAFEYRNAATGKFAGKGEVAFIGVDGMTVNNVKLCNECGEKIVGEWFRCETS